jgi:carbamoyl-phosphate synthase large subunit
LNVLITSASRKVLLVRAFQDAAARLGGGRVIAADIDPLAASLYEADGARLIPPSADSSFVDALLDVCRHDEIGLLVPTRDDELPLLAANRARFEAIGTLVLVSPPDAVAACRDKRRFADAASALGYETPRTWPPSVDAPLPAFVKPIIGRGGRGARSVRTRGELAAALTEAGGDLIVQELIEAPELTIDAFLALDGTPISCVPRIRVSVACGESVVSRTVRDPELVDAALGLASGLRLAGHVTIQAFRPPDRILFIEVNPRYGGAANLGFAAGAPTPEFAIRMARGERLEPRLGAYVDDLVMLRYSEDRILPAAVLMERSRP